MSTAEQFPLSDSQVALIARALADSRRYRILVQIGASEQALPCAEVLKAHVDHWVDEAAERFGEFSIGAYGFAVELRIDDEVELGWAYGGAMSPGAAELFGRAAEQARGGVDRGDG